MSGRRRGHGEGSVYRRADGRWAGVLDVSEQGQPRRRRFVYGKTQREAIEALKALEHEVRRGVVVDGSHETLGAYLARWLRRDRPVGARTANRYRELVTGHLLPDPIAKVRLDRLRVSDVNGLIERLGAKTTRGRLLSPQTVAHCRSVLRTALAEAVADEVVGRNVAAGRAVKVPRINGHHVEALTPQQADAIVEAVSDDPLAPLYTLALHSGLRQGELLGLRWADIDERGRRLRVEQTFGIVGNVGMFENRAKTEKSRRSVPLGAKALAALDAQRRRQAEARLKAGVDWQDWSDTLPLVFTDDYGQPLDPRDVTKHLHVLLAPIGLRTFRFHDLRHGYATLLIRAGVPIPTVAKILGHSTAVMTLNVYGHVADESLDEAAGRFDRLMLAG